MHEDAAHLWSARHGVLHAPQCAALEAGSTHTVAPATAQRRSGASHVLEHNPALQTLPALHADPQLPQFARSIATSMHRPAQSVSPDVHSHRADVQTLFIGQALLHIPQFNRSLSTATHTPPHAI